MGNMWRYWKEKYGVLEAAEGCFAEQCKTDEIAYSAYQQAKVALYALEKRMDELAEAADYED